MSGGQEAKGGDLYRTLFDVNSDALFVHDETGHILMVNARMREMFGFNASEPITQSIGELSANVPPYNQEQARRHVDYAIRHGSKIFDWQSRRRDGTTFWSEVSLRPFRIEGRLHVMACVRDIAARKQTEGTLLASEQRFSAIFNNMSSMLAFTDPANGVIIDVNHTWVEATGFSRQEALGRTGSELGLWTNRQDRETIMNLIRENRQLRDREVELTLRGKPIQALISASVVSVGAVDYLLWEIRDISETKRIQGEREKLRSQLQFAQKMESVGRLAGGVAHDFNNLLTVITNCSQFLLQDLERHTASFELVVDIQQAAERATSLTQQLLAFSRRNIMQPRPLDLNGLVEQTEHMLARLIGEDIQVLVLCDPTTPQVYADPNLIHQVLMNLSVNARDAMPHGGRLTIETGVVHLTNPPMTESGSPRGGHFARLSITDTGVGMDETTLAHLFEPFFTTKPQGKGTGLGLSTVYGIVEQSGGFIAVYSEIGIGTTFKIHLPVFQGDTAAATQAVATAIHSDKHETVLVVEDENEVRRLTLRILAKLGYQVLHAKSGESALELVRQHEGTIEVLLTDVILPGISGRVLSEELKVLRPELKVVFMSGYTDDVVVRHGILERGVAFLQKPFSLTRLSQILRDVLDKEAFGNRD